MTDGGATIRVSDLIGKSRMIDMILMGRVYQGREAVNLGLAQYITDGSSLDMALELANKAAANLPLTNFAICSAVSHMNNISALCVTVDTAVAGNRERDIVTGMTIPPSLTARSLLNFAGKWSWLAGLRHNQDFTLANLGENIDPLKSGALSIFEYVNQQFDPSISWADIGWLREHWELPLS